LVVLLGDDAAAWVSRTMEDLQLTEAPLTVEVALAIASLNFPHGDAPDRFLQATAKVLDLTLVTADEPCYSFPEFMD
jgi:PIN domain nuclease of toxin-antitoxin system